jgi:hypothetical protein
MKPEAVRLVSESAFQQTVVEYARAKGWKVWFTWKSYHSPKGEPDLRMVRPPRYVLMELKKVDGRLTPDQKEAGELLAQCPGVESYCFWPKDWPRIEEVLE